MKSDEFNKVRITNEKHGFANYEFGHTQSSEYTFFSDNKINIKNEINDNPASNSHNKQESQRRKSKEDELRDRLTRDNGSSNPSDSGSSSSSSASNSSNSASSSSSVSSSGATSSAGASSAASASAAASSSAAIATVAAASG